MTDRDSAYRLKYIYFRDGKPCNQFDPALFIAVLFASHNIACPSGSISILIRALQREANRQNCSMADLFFKAMVDYCVELERKQYNLFASQE